MRIFTQRLMIRQFEFGDWRMLRAIAAEFQASEYRYFDREIPTALDEIRAVARYCADSGIWFSVLLNGEMIGYICLSQNEEGIDVGYAFHSSARGKGYAFESISATLELLESAGVRKFTAGTALENAPSMRLLKRLGFRQVREEEVCFYEGHPFRGGFFVREVGDSLDGEFSE